jgi:copper chaperone
MLRFHVPGMTCSGCVGAVTRAIQAVDNQARIEADLSVREVRVASRSPEAAVSAALDEAGYPNAVDWAPAGRPRASA